MRQLAPKRAALTPDETRYFLRRLVFAATPSLKAVVRGPTADVAPEALFVAERRAPAGVPPESVREVCTNQALTRQWVRCRWSPASSMLPTVRSFQQAVDLVAPILE
jgi:hypothetical protein